MLEHDEFKMCLRNVTCTILLHKYITCTTKLFALLLFKGLYHVLGVKLMSILSVKLLIIFMNLNVRMVVVG